MEEIELCSGMPSSEEEWEEMVKENPDLVEDNPLKL